MVLASAAIEAYLEDVLAAYCSALCAAGATAATLPPTLRAHLANSQELADAYRRYVASGDEEQLHASLISLFDSEAASLSSGATVPVFGPSRIYGTKRYPSVKNIKSMFRRLGIPKIFSRLNARVRGFAELQLQSFNDVRNALAHEGKVTSVSVDDVRSRIAAVARLLGALDREIWSSYPNVWKNGGWKV
jgi:hypothetical protein